MSAHDQWTDQLSDYLDDELSQTERAAVEAHLAECADCARTLASLKRIVAEASSLTPEPPQNDLWPGIAARTTQPRRVSFTIPQLAAASLLLAALSGGAVVMLLGSGRSQSAANQGGTIDTPPMDSTTPVAGALSAAIGSDAGLATVVNVADAQYDEAVAELERALEEGRGRLDAATISVVEQNLSIIDLAIAEARGALVADPANGFLSGHLVEARRRKLDLLRRAAALTQVN
jgi:putative zinc finger protein